MATRTQKLTLSPSRDIPFNRLVLSQANVRCIKAGLSIEELAEDIARRTLLQSLSVRPLLDAEGAETGLYEVPAGGRRFRALELLVKQKRLAKAAPVPCVVRDPSSDILAEDDSLAENMQRAPLHPLDQFRAFQAMRDKGMAEEDIAAGFFVSANVVRQRLRLAAVSDVLLEVYAEDDMTLDQLMAFAVSSDHARQEQVWQAIQSSWSKEPYQIRRMLTETSVRASDKRAVFVGLDAYEKAGGIVARDLFQQDDGGWLEDIGLLDRLVAEKLKKAAEAVTAEGWRWIEASVDFPYDHTRLLRKLDGVPVDLTAEEQATRDALQAEQAKLEAEYEGADEIPDEIDARLGEIEAALARLEERPKTYDPAEVARAGVFIGIDADGALSVDRGYVRPEDEAQAEPEHNGDGDMPDATPGSGPPAIRGATITVAGQPAEPDAEEDDAIRPLPDRLVMELTAHRTLALRDALAGNPHVALTALLHRLVTDRFRYNSAAGAALEVQVRHFGFPVQAPDLKDSPSAKSIAERHEGWRADIPGNDQKLWGWLDRLDAASRLALLAHCVSFGVNALCEKIDRFGGAGLSHHGLDRRLREADQLAQAVGLDMAEEGWTPTVDNYLGRVTKPRILDAVREGRGEPSVQLIEHLKKGDMAREAERLLAGTGWLPEPLRGALLQVTPLRGAAPETDAVVDGQDDAGTLPDFLTADLASTGQAPQAVAAE